jgi:geranylgeranyl diphosphate synthase type I
LELLHNFSLIHDDIMDNDRTRRHRPTVWAIWGEAQAINAGDLLNVLATLSVLRAPRDPEHTALVRTAVDVLARGCARMTEGQHLDVAFETRDDVTVDEYLEMVNGKTAALIGVAFELGAIFAGNQPEMRARCRNYGRTLGAAFQIRDDLLGIWGDPTLTGKSAGSDIRKRKKTLPIVHGMQAAPPEDREYLRAMFTDRSVEPDVEAARAILARAGSRAFAEAEASRLLADTRLWLDQLPVSAWGRQALTDVAAFIIGRAK